MPFRHSLRAQIQISTPKSHAGRPLAVPGVSNLRALTG
jgi:hypothetical protein